MGSVTRESLLGRYRSLTELELQAILVSPDFTPEAQSAARQELAGRGIAPVAPVPDQPVRRRPLTGGDTPTAPAFRAYLEERARSARSTRRRFRRTLLGVILLVATINVALVAAGPKWARRFDSGSLDWLQVPVVLLIMFPVTWTGLHYFFANVACWRWPLKFALLRHFGYGKITRALRNVSRHHLGNLGFCYALRDPMVPLEGARTTDVVRAVVGRIVPGGWLLVPRSWLWPFIWFANTIGSERQLARFGSMLEDKPWDRWLFSRDKIEDISSDDRCWQAAVGVLLDHVDVVLVDLSEVSAGVEWEIDELRRRDLARSTVWVCAAGSSDRARAFLAARLAAKPPVVHEFDGSGEVTDPEEFQTALIDAAICRRYPGEAASDPAAIAPAT